MSFTTMNVNFPFPAQSYPADTLKTMYPVSTIIFSPSNINEVYFFVINLPTEEIYGGMIHDYVSGMMLVYDGATLKGSIPFEVYRGEQKYYGLRPDYYPFTNITLKINTWRVKFTQNVNIPVDSVIDLALPPFIRMWTARSDYTVVEGAIIFMRRLITSPIIYQNITTPGAYTVNLSLTNIDAYVSYLYVRIHEIVGSPTTEDTLKVEAYQDTTKKGEWIIQLSNLPTPPPNYLLAIRYPDIKPINRLIFTPTFVNVYRVRTSLLMGVI